MKFPSTRIPTCLGIFGFLIASAVSLFAGDPAPAADYYTEPLVYELRPNPASESNFGNVGVTGLRLRVYPGVVLKVDDVVPGSPADGKFNKGEVISSVNGVALEGHNPYVILGEALTKAEAGDGNLVFDVVSADGKESRKVAVAVPVLGAYGPNWPLDCRKSQEIIKNAAAYYAKNEKGGVEGGLRCLFLLSTGDDQYLPAVKAYFDRMKGFGQCTWANGYNGVACAEYYLRTGDESVLPVIQTICDAARDSQFYGVAWAHNMGVCNPRYVSGGVMNPAASQIVTTLLLARECGLDVDEKTLLGALKHFYRFAGHGAVPYGDHRGEGLGSNGKDGMAAAIMHIASEAEGDVAIYEKARNRFAMSMIDSYSGMICGHADEGRGDAIWRSIAPAYLKDTRPEAYQGHQDRLRWWYDLSRRPSGAFGISSCKAFDDEASGAGVALAYTAPLKTLRITGAPRSRFAKAFTLPEQLWGRKADLDFLSVENGKPYGTYGEDEPIHQIANKVGEMYSKPSVKLAETPRAEILKAVYHQNYVIRAQAAKALRLIGALDELETLLQDQDPRVRRAALDGLIDYQYWHFIGREAIRPEKVTPVMLAAFRKMISDPEESLFVVDGALLALSCAAPSNIVESLPLIEPWTNSDEWWLRQGSFNALANAAGDEAFAAKLLPILAGMFLREDRAQIRELMTNKMSMLARKYTPDSEQGKQLASIFKMAVDEIDIIPGFRSGAGGFYVQNTVLTALNSYPNTSLDLARSLKTRLPEIRTDYLMAMVDALVAACGKFENSGKQELVDLLYGDYRQELIKRMNAGELHLDAILKLTQLKDKNAGWRELGSPLSADRVWQFTSFEPQAKDFLTPREIHRFREVVLPAGLETWWRPEFDAGEWSNGKAPIGKGAFKLKHAKEAAFTNQSTWGKGEFLLARTTFDVDSLDYDFFRFTVLAGQGYRIFLNGHQVAQYGWWADPQYNPKELGPNELKHLKKGTNVIAVYANAAYKDNKEGEELIGQFDVRLEGLRKADFMVEAGKK